MNVTNKKARAGRLAAIFSVASVLFGWHAGGGFATGNQANQFFVVSGWLGPLSALLSLLLLTLTIRQAIIMYNSRKLINYKELLETLYHPVDKLEYVFELYYYIMVLMCLSSCIAGAATLLVDAMGMNYYLSIVLIGVVLLALTVFGAGLVRKVSSVMSVLILVCAVLIFIFGIARKLGEISLVFSGGMDMEKLPSAIVKAFQYAGFQCSSIPTMIACGTVLTSEKDVKNSMWVSFVMNAIALFLSVFMLLGWQSVYTAIEGGTMLPTLTVCKEMGLRPLVWAYFICLFLCFISTGVGAVFGVVNRFESNKWLSARVPNELVRSGSISLLIMVIAMFISLVGLTNIIKYGYGYCGYVGIVILVIPFLTVGVYKNRKFLAEQKKNLPRSNR